MNLSTREVHIKTDVNNRYNTPTGTQHCTKSTVIVLPVALAASVGMKKIADATDSTDNPFPRKQILNWLGAQRMELWNDEVAHLPVDIGKKIAEGDEGKAPDVLS